MVQKIQIAMTLLVPDGDRRWEDMDMCEIARETLTGDWAMSWDTIEEKTLTTEEILEACEDLSCDPEFFGIE